MDLDPHVEQLLDECFAGDRDRDCANCASPYWKKDGTCCFGDPQKRDETASQCQKCNHYWECGEEIKAAKAAERPVHSPRMAKAPSKPSRFAVNSPRQQRDDLVQIGGGRKRPRPPQGPGPAQRVARPATPSEQQVRTTEEPLAQRWMKDTIWGGLHGMSSASEWFFENYYWE